MREMKDSGVAWIGEIPEEWVCCKQKYAMKLINGRAYSDSEFEKDGKYKILRVGNLFSNPVWYTSNLELPENKYCSSGDLLYSWSMSYAPVFWYGEKVIYHYHIWKVNLNDKIQKKFAYYYLVALTDALKAEIHETTMGFITMGVMNNSYIAIPNIAEQQTIATYLDQKCTQIDALITNQQKQIERLKAYKQSLITETVTKGLNPDVPMKDSGVEWIGEIPEDWEVIRVKNLLNERKERSLTGEEEPLSMSQKVGLVPTKILDMIPNMASSFVGAKIVYINDLVFNKLKAHLGVFSVSMYNGLVSPDYAVYYSTGKANLKYLEYLFKTPQCISEFRKRSTGIAAGLTRLYTDGLFAIECPYPSFNEQQAIVSYLDQKCTQIDKLISIKQKKIEKLQQYKKSVIYEYVTGKKEVK